MVERVTDIERVPLSAEQLRQNRFHHDIGQLGTAWIDKSTNPETSAWLVRASVVLEHVSVLARAQAVQGRLAAGLSVDEAAAELGLARQTVTDIIEDGQFQLAAGSDTGVELAGRVHGTLIAFGDEKGLLGPDRPEAASPGRISAALVSHWLESDGIDTPSLVIEEHVREGVLTEVDSDVETPYLEQYVTVAATDDDVRDAVRHSLTAVGLTISTMSWEPDLDRFSLPAEADEQQAR
jgi:hypothetical protein